MRSYKSVYREHEVIGQGKFTHVVLVENLETHLFCIAKKSVISSLPPKDQDSSLQELSLLKNLSHPNIVTYHESFLEDGTLIIIMEYCEEGDIFYHIQQQTLRSEYFPERTVLNWFLQAVMAVEFLHRSQILHRDIKTSNIFLTSCGSIKLGDFGIAKVLTATHQISNTLVGTPNYLSPELCENRPYTYKADMWALGCVLYEMLTLKIPFQSNNLMELIIKITRDELEPVPKQYSKEVKLLVRSLLNKDEKKRPSCQEILAKPIFIKVMQDFITGGAKQLIQKKVPIKQYSLHSQLKKRTPEKIIHKLTPDPKKQPNKLNHKNPAELVKQLRIRSPVPVKGLSLSNTPKANPKNTPKKQGASQNSKGKTLIKPKSSVGKKPVQKPIEKPLNDDKSKLRIAGIGIKSNPNSSKGSIFSASSQRESQEKFRKSEQELENARTGKTTNTPTQGESNEDPTINSIMLNTEMSFNISLTQDSAFYTKADGKLKIKEIEDLPAPSEQKEIMLIDENAPQEDPIFDGIEIREDDESSLEEEYKEDFESEDDPEKFGRLTLPKTKEKLNEILDLYRTQLAESQKMAQTSLYEGNLKVIDEELNEASSQNTSKKTGDFEEIKGI